MALDSLDRALRDLRADAPWDSWSVWPIAAGSADNDGVSRAGAIPIDVDSHHDACPTAGESQEQSVL